MLEELLLRLLQRWRSMSANQFLQVAVPAVLSLDMLHNIYVVTLQWQSRVQAWKEEDEREVTSQVREVLWNIAGHCSSKDEEVWPMAVAKHMGLRHLELKETKSPEQIETLKQEEPDLLIWLTLPKQAVPDAQSVPNPVTDRPATTQSEPLGQPDPVLFQTQIQQRLKMAATIIAASRQIAAAQLQRLGIMAAVEEQGSPEGQSIGLESWQRMQAGSMGDDSSSSNLHGHPSSFKGQCTDDSWSSRIADALESKVDSWCQAAQNRWPIPKASIRRRSALRFRVKWHGLTWPACEQQQHCEVDLSDL